jgi:hypothetical protein
MRESLVFRWAIAIYTTIGLIACAAGHWLDSLLPFAVAAIFCLCLRGTGKCNESINDNDQPVDWADWEGY